MLAEYGSNSICSQYSGTGTAVVNGSFNTIGANRNATINGTSYRGMFSGESGIRATAWAMRDMACAQIANFDNSSWNTYFEDIFNDSVDGMAAYRSMLVSGADPFVTTVGIWDEGSGNDGGMWQVGYCIGAFCLAYAVTENATALAQANYMVKLPTWVASTTSTYCVGNYRQSLRQSPVDTGLYTTLAEKFGFLGWNVTWDSGTNLFTLMSAPTGVTFGNDDIVIFNPPEGVAPPTGFTANVGYYVVQTSGSTFKLSATQGGSAITLTTTNSGPSPVFVRPTQAHCPTTGAIDNQSASGYQCNLTAVSNWLNAIGGTVDSGYLTAMAARVATFPSITAQFNDDPKYAIGSTYV